MSHIALWKRAVAHGQALTIAEDDAIFHGQFRRHAAAVMANLPPAWDIILWGWNFDLFVSIVMFPGVCSRLAQFEQITSEAGVQAFQQQEVCAAPAQARWAFGTPCPRPP